MGAFEADWRERLHLPLRVVGTVEMSWGEALRHARRFAKEPSTALAAALEGWDHPISREALILMDHFDLDHQVAAGRKKPPPHPGRPMRPKIIDELDDKWTGPRSSGQRRSNDEVKAILERMRQGQAPV